jgi:hypothetical protein
VRLTIAVAFAVAAPLLLFGSAGAQTEEEAVVLDYRAPATCENGAQFLARVRARAPRVRLSRPSERARMFVVEIEQRGGRAFGRLTVRNPEGRQTVREIEAKDCTEAVDALALIVALAVNPRAAEMPPTAVNPRTAEAPTGVTPSATEAPPPSPTSPSAEAPRAAPTAAPQTEPSAAAPAARVNAPTASAQTPASSPESPADVQAGGTDSEGASRWAFRAGLSGWGIGAIAPAPLLGARAGGEMVHLASQVLAPSFRISGGYTTHAGFVVDGGTAHFEYGGANLELCPIRLPATGSLLLRPCAMADIGLIFARGTDALNARGEDRPWLALGGGGRLEWALGRRVALDLDVGCTFPVWRDRFLFGPRAFHRVGLASGVVALGLVVRIP